VEWAALATVETNNKSSLSSGAKKMTPRQKMDAQEQRMEIFKRDGFKCGHCGLSVYRHGTPQIAHRIGQGKMNVEKFGESVIHHPLNMVGTCSLYCNGRMNIGMRPAEANDLAETIRDKMLGE
jgi:hypothetical protein